MVDNASNDFIRVVVPTKTTWTAGQHYFVRFSSFGRHSLSTHPFTVCSLPTRAPASVAAQSELVFYIRPQGGFTSALAKHAEQNPSFTTKVLIDGPYGGTNLQQVARATRLIFVAGGSGAGWLLPMMETFLRQVGSSKYLEVSSDNAGGRVEKSDKRSARVILATRDRATEAWFAAAVDELYSKYVAVDPANHLEIEVHCTTTDRVRSTGEATRDNSNSNGSLDARQRSPDAEKALPRADLAKGHSYGRPDLPEIIASEAKEGSRITGVFACGPLSMQHDLSNAVANQQLGIMKNGSEEMYLHMEHFSWA